MLIIKRNEDALIDSTGNPDTAGQTRVIQADTPGRDLMAFGPATRPELPDPDIGGQNGSRIRNGFSLGFRGIRARVAAFDGRMAELPAIVNPVQGNVGATARASNQYVGVLNQLAQYRADSSALARSVTGV